jgi:GcrA cell cycle regulator
MPHNNAHHHNWTEARIKQLKELWFEGFSASECGDKLGVSRNSVIGKIYRLGLTGSDRKRRVTSMPNPRKANAVPTMQEEVRIDSRFLSIRSFPATPFTLKLLELRPGMCRWPQGDRAPYRFCGAEQAPSSSYCEEHRRLSMSGRQLQPVHFNVKAWGT